MPSGIPLESSSQGLFAESLISWVFSSARKAIFDPATRCFTRRGDMLLVRLNGMGDGSRPTGQMRGGPNGSMHVRYRPGEHSDHAARSDRRFFPHLFTDPRI
ncbi:hypothetical protein THAOC_34056, partial [Thalassiosira oceanica]